MTLNDRIRDARKRSGLSVNRFSKLVGVSAKAAGHWDRAETKPTPDKLPKIAQVLGVSVEDLTTAHPAQPDKTSTERETLDSILNDARARIGRLLGITPDRVEVAFSLKS